MAISKDIYDSDAPDRAELNLLSEEIFKKRARELSIGVGDCKMLSASGVRPYTIVTDDLIRRYRDTGIIW